MKAHGFRLTRSMDGEGGLRTLREELEAENEGVLTPSNIRCPDEREDIRPRRLAKEIAAPSVVFAVAGEETFAHLCRTSLRLLGRRYEVELFEED